MKKKREHKDTMIRAVENFLTFQFIVLFALILITLLAIYIFHGLKNDISDETFKIIIGFLGVYITSVVVELIYILKYIIVNVFDTSINGLVKIFSVKDDLDDKAK